MTINADWHNKNKMPKNPSWEQRMKWHIKHLKYCNCHPPSLKLVEEMKKYEEK